MNRIRTYQFQQKSYHGLTKTENNKYTSCHTLFLLLLLQLSFVDRFCCAIFVLCSPLNVLGTLLRKDPILCYQCDFLEQNLVLPTLSMGLGTLEHWYRLEVNCDFLISCILASHLLHHPAICKIWLKVEHSPSFLYLKPCTKKCTVSNIKSFNTSAATESFWY